VWQLDRTAVARGYGNTKMRSNNDSGNDLPLVLALWAVAVVVVIFLMNLVVVMTR
jgi:hypothetical protein